MSRPAEDPAPRRVPHPRSADRAGVTSVIRTRPLTPESTTTVIPHEGLIPRDATIPREATVPRRRPPAHQPARTPAARTRTVAGETTRLDTGGDEPRPDRVTVWIRYREARSEADPVFVDGTGRRRVLWRVLGAVLAALCVAFVVVIVVATLTGAPVAP